MLAKDELRELADDIKANGLQQPIVMQADVLLDGRNRLAACKLADVSPKFTEYRGDSPVAFIIGVNLRRRHLDKGQKIAIGLETEPFFAAEATERKRLHGGTAPGKASLTGKSSVSVDRHENEAMTQVAKAVGVSSKTLSAAKAIKAKSPESFEKIKTGEMTVNQAKRVVIREEKRQDLDRKAEAVGILVPGTTICMTIDDKVFGVCFRCRRDITSPPWHVRLDSGRTLMCAACEPSWRGLPGDWKPRRPKPSTQAMEAAATLFAGAVE